jgi:hypothetical protein
MNTSISFDLEQRIVLACALAPNAAGSGPLVDLGPADSIDWARLRAVAAAFGVRPLVARGLAGAAPDELDACISAARANEGRTRLLTGELLAILDALAAVGVRAIPFKGPVLEHTLGAAPGLREMGDLDFLVRTEHLLTATRALAPLGYRSVLPIHALAYPGVDRVSPEWPLLRPADGLLIELHCRLAPAWFPTPCSLRDVEARQQSITLAGNRIAWPAPEELLLVHIADGMKSCGRGMKWLGDVARILRRHPELDWAHIRSIASRHGGLNVVRVALALVIDCCAEVAESLGAHELELRVAPQAEALAADAGGGGPPSPRPAPPGRGPRRAWRARSSRSGPRCGATLRSRARWRIFAGRFASRTTPRGPLLPSSATSRVRRSPTWRRTLRPRASCHCR